MQLPPPVHGVTVVNQTVARSELLASRFDIEVLPLAFSASFEDLDRPSLRKLGRLIHISARLALALVARRPDAVYFTLAPTGSAFYRDCILVGIMKLARVRRIYHLHGHVRASRRSKLYRWAFRDAWVIQLSDRLRAELADVVPRERVFVVPNGVSERAAPDRTMHRGRVRLLFLSNLTKTKGPLVLIEALGMLRARGIAFDATLAGAVHEDKFLAACQTEIRRHGLEQQVRYVGPAYAEDKHRLFDEHDVFVHPTRRDAFPLVVLEAMQAGLPVVTTHEGALPEIVEDGETGRLVPPGDPVALANCLATLVADRELQRRMGSKGRARCLEKFMHAAFEQNLAAALTTCLETGGGES
jgi:glycosyltransferase involved in cell wall biosynthesis